MGEKKKVVSAIKHKQSLNQMCRQFYGFDVGFMILTSYYSDAENYSSAKMYPFYLTEFGFGSQMKKARGWDDGLLLLREVPQQCRTKSLWIMQLFFSFVLSFPTNPDFLSCQRHDNNKKSTRSPM